MDHRDIRTLNILEELGKGGAPSQRDLAKRLNISLGLVNSFLKRFVQKGYLKITTIPNNRIKYILTPRGAAEKTKLAYEYIQYSYCFYRDARQKLRKVLKNLDAHKVRRIVFYGAGDLAEIAYISLMETSIQLVAVVDDLKNGKPFYKQMVISSDELDSVKFDRVLIATISHKEKALDRLKAKKISRKSIVMLED
jgi:DNA-binding MarR family transcriptional regulator